MRRRRRGGGSLASEAEDTVLEVFVALEGEKKGSWKENKKLKLAQKKDRRQFCS